MSLRPALLLSLIKVSSAAERERETQKTDTGTQKLKACIFLTDLLRDSHLLGNSRLDLGDCIGLYKTE